MSNTKIDEFRDITDRFNKVLKKAKLSESYNVLDVIGVKKKELIFSRILAWLLNENAEHEHQNEFLISFLAELNISVDSSIYTGYSVQTEYMEQESRIDICIYKPKTFLIFIENKTVSEERTNQLRDEYKSMTRLRKRLKVPKDACFLIFLTPTGRDPVTDTSGKWYTMDFICLATAIKKVINKKTNLKTKDFISDIIDWYHKMSEEKMNDFTHEDIFLINNNKDIKRIIRANENLQSKLILRLENQISRLVKKEDNWIVKPVGRTQRYVVHKEWVINGKDVVWIGVERFTVERLFYNDSLSFPIFYVWVYKEDRVLVDSLRKLLKNEKGVIGKIEEEGTGNAYVVKHNFEKLLLDELPNIDSIIEKRIDKFFTFYMKFADSIKNTLDVYFKEKNR